MKKVIDRVLDYSKKTGIIFRDTGRTHFIKSLPDMRGFSPHLRQVNLNKNQKKDLWVIHDLLHIMFYDFVTFHLGEIAWKDKLRFFENHLASEAFAVLVLDYHVLSFQKRGGLAVDIKASKWKSFQKLNPELPPFLSEEFCALLLSLYLSGEAEELLAPKNRKDYDIWIGHELRYSEKQRFYVHSWWRDLNLEVSPRESFVLQKSEVHYAVWELLNLLLYKSDKEWKNWTNQIVSKDLPENLFAQLPKFKNIPSSYDFRFTDYNAVNISNYLENVSMPNPSDLFLFWQIISESKKLNPAIKKLAKDSQGLKIDIKIWNKVRLFCKKMHKPKKNVNSHLLGNFFLP